MSEKLANMLVAVMVVASAAPGRRVPNRPTWRACRCSETVSRLGGNSATC